MSQTFTGLAQRALSIMTSSAQFTPKDQEIISQFKDQLLQLRDAMVKEFYDSLFANPATAAIFQPGERQAREKSLADWWTRTIEGPVNDDYWAWQSYVGLLHVKRQVTNATMFSQIMFLISFLRRHFPGQDELLGALERLLASVAAVIAHSYDVFVAKTVERVTGVSDALFAQQVAVGVDELLRDFKR